MSDKTVNRKGSVSEDLPLTDHRRARWGCARSRSAQSADCIHILSQHSPRSPPQGAGVSTSLLNAAMFQLYNQNNYFHHLWTKLAHGVMEDVGSSPGIMNIFSG